MKILHISSSDLSGGAAIAAFRLHRGLNNYKEIESVMIVRDKVSVDKNIFIINDIFKVKFKAKIRWFFVKVGKKISSKIAKSPFSIIYLPKSKIKNAIKKINPQIIHIHWLDETILTFKDLNELDIPVVYTMHDMWVFTGGCHYTQDCERFKLGCGKCPVLDSKISNDLSKFIFNKKKKGIKATKSISFLSVSKWLSSLAKLSPILGNLDIQTLPNLIDTSIFEIRTVENAKKRLGLNKDKKYILFGAINSIGDPRKGWKILVKALESLKFTNVELLVFGNNDDIEKEIACFKVISFNQINNVNKIIDLYCSADVMIVPSIQEAFGQTITEAMACGTPVVSFEGTGPSDIIKHLENGYLAKSNSYIDLAEGIEFFITKKVDKIFRQNCRNHILENFSIDKNIIRYIQFYNNIYNEYQST